MGASLLQRLDLRGTTQDLASLLPPAAVDHGVGQAVSDIIDAVRTRGDAALYELTERFDHVTLSDLAVSDDEIADAHVDARLAEALDIARDQIIAWHEAQHEPEIVHERRGIQIRELVVPVDRVGCYVPGGTAPLVSSVLMTVVPAVIAGVQNITLCTPPGPDGRIHPAILTAARLAGATHIYRVGGAQAIAAMAYGTKTIAAADVIVGPGNAYVAEAKQQVAAGGVVGIDGFAGPSEVAIIAGRIATPAYVAIDMLAQAEHGPGGIITLITWDELTAAAVEASLAAQLEHMARKAEAAATLATGGRIILVDDAHQAISVANHLAPEHLELICANADELIGSIRNAGAVFVGEYAPAAVGDYIAGSNHVLPTARTARFASALRVADLHKHIHVVTLDAAGLKGVAPHIRALAEAEGLAAHAESVRIRSER